MRIVAQRIRDGRALDVNVADDGVVVTQASSSARVELTTAELKWLVHTGGPAALAELAKANPDA